MAKEQIDLMTGEQLVFADQASVEASSVSHKAVAFALSAAAIALCGPGGVGVPSPRSEAVTVTLETEGEGDRPKIPSQRHPKLFSSQPAWQR